MEANLPNNWAARDYQKPVCDYLDAGGKHAELIWHRRAGKDDVCMHHAACQMADRPATYWHMLPLANQVRKAIWEAVNPHSGKRRVFEAFPPELFTHRDTDMLVKAKFNASTWQCIGSDNYEGAIGSPPAGIVYSEWAQANPSARGYLRPILTENNGYQIYITTPRGKNHAYSTYKAAKKNPNAFAQLLTVHDTGVLTPGQLQIELMEYVNTYGEAMGLALYEQEYECSFDAAILGAYYGAEMARIDKEGRICEVIHNPDYPVHVVFDIGYDDDTAIFWFQVYGNEIHILESYFNSGKDPDHYASQVMGRKVSINIIEGKIEVSTGRSIQGLEHRHEYNYGSINLPHDAKAKTFAAHGKSIEEQFAKVFGWGKIEVVPGLSVVDGINAARKALNRANIDESCEDAFEAVRQYHREWDDDKKMFKDKPFHDWTSHYADALRYLGVCWTEDTLPKELEPTRWPQHRSFDEMMQHVANRRIEEEEY